ncbi:MAG TPA: site-2 protease family protein [Candidatus Dormibacteraeota bacterium]|nr:site-2 protease family protein [Candidatus Dormibacteraeota bacterium]
MSFGWQTIPAILLVLFVVISFHELGHFLLAKWSGIRVDEFAVGFGPKVYGRQIGETLYSIRLVPAGGYVRMAGMMGIEGEADAGERNFYRATIPRKSATILAGGIFNLFLAGVLFAVAAVPAIPASIGVDSPLALAGVTADEPLLKAGGIPIDPHDRDKASDAVHRATAASRGGVIPVVYRDHGGRERTVRVAPLLVLDNERVPSNDAARKAAPPQGLLVVDTVEGRPQRQGDTPLLTGDPAQLLGSGRPVRVGGHILGAPDQRFTDATLAGVVDGAQAGPGAVAASWKLGVGPGEQARSLPAALAAGFREVPTQISGTFTGVYSLITNPNTGGVLGPNGVSGPVGIVRITNVVAKSGWLNLITWMGTLSVALGVFNLLPIPFLDGGRFVFIVLEALRRRRVRPQLEMAVHYAGLMVLLTFVILVTIHDIQGNQ